MQRTSTSFVLALFIAVLALQATSRADVSALIEKTYSTDPDIAKEATASLRDAGPGGLDAILDQYDKTHDSRLLPAIDAVAGQRGATVSRLYWYTDLDQAKAAANREKKPILYLRMMGKLTDEYSCANSRFFRTVLYSNKDVSRLLRERFILVWVSERPAPVVTIDYGDGRILKRTITGNSIHYVLDADGRVIDALPGLYSPATFSRILVVSQNVALARPSLNDEYLQWYWRSNDEQLLRGWQADSVNTSVQVVAGKSNNNREVVQAGKNPPAAAAMPLAVSKSAVEAPILARISPQFGAALAQSIDQADARTWELVANRHGDDARLDASSIAVIKSENPKEYSDDIALARTVERFQHLIALDTAHNNYQFRRQILGWLRQSPDKRGVEELNQRVYSELFLTPRSDPWLGLVADEYTGLGTDACSVAAK